MSYSQQLLVDEQCRSGSLWEGLLLNLSSNCKCERRSPASPPHWSLYFLPQRLCKKRTLGACEWTPTLERTSVSPLDRTSAFERATILTVVKRRVAWALCGPLLVSSTGDAGCSENVPGMSKCSLPEPRLRMLLASDSRSVVMKVETCSEVCNNSPAEASGSENGWRTRVLLTPSRLRYVDSLVVARLEEQRAAETQSCRGIPRGTFSEPSLGSGRRGARIPFWQMPGLMPP